MTERLHDQVDSVICGDDIDRINLVRMRLMTQVRLDFDDMRDLARMLTGVLTRAIRRDPCKPSEDSSSPSTDAPAAS
jgi:hypothetical protein